MKKIRIFFISFISMLFLMSCHGGKSTKGYDYAGHKRDNAERMKETRERNKKTKSLLNHKGKSVKKPKPEYP
ncbi:MAG: hypothetical protein RLY35_590 [Bacteroidota bacterium]